VPLRTNDP